MTRGGRPCHGELPAPAARPASVPPPAPGASQHPALPTAPVPAPVTPPALARVGDGELVRVQQGVRRRFTHSLRAVRARQAEQQLHHLRARRRRLRIDDVRVYGERRTRASHKRDVQRPGVSHVLAVVLTLGPMQRHVRRGCSSTRGSMRRDSRRHGPSTSTSSTHPAVKKPAFTLVRIKPLTTNVQPHQLSDRMKHVSTSVKRPLPLIKPIDRIYE